MTNFLFKNKDSFENRYSFEQRLNESYNILLRYPDRIPIICERSKIANNDCPFIDKNKYLVPRELTIGQFIYVIRKRLKITHEKAIFLFIDNNILPSSKMFGEIYEFYKNADCFLYINYSFENTFG
jgi:GABA(A) receptor-associated protein